MGSGPTWVNPNGHRQDNYQGRKEEYQKDRTVTDPNQIKMGWRKDEPKAPPNLRAYDPVMLAQGDYPYYNSYDGYWQNPDGSKTTGSGPTWVNPNGVREDNYENDIPTRRTVTDEN